MSLAVAIHSAIVNTSGDFPVNVFLVHDGISGRNEGRLREVVRSASPRATLTLLRLDQGNLGQLGTPGHFTMAAYFRIMLPEVMPARESKVIYLDSDLLVRGDLSVLWQMDMKGMPLMAVRDFAVPFASSKASGLHHIVPRLRPGTPFLNSGVMVMDLNIWRFENISKKIINFSLENEATAGLDQVGINAIICGRWLELDQLWNVQVYINADHNLNYIEKCDFLEKLIVKRKFLMKNAFVYHFSGGRKPWAPGCALPGQFAWLRSLRRSGWHNTCFFIVFFVVISIDIAFRKTIRSVRAFSRGFARRDLAGDGVTA